MMSFLMGMLSAVKADVATSTSSLLERISRPINAFLNSSGGSLYMGIRDNGQVGGLIISRKTRDIIRLAVDSAVQSMEPTPASSVVVQFVPVCQSKFHRYVELKDSFVIAVHVEKGTDTYQTHQHECFRRLEASVFGMSYGELTRQKQKQDMDALLEQNRKLLELTRQQQKQDLETVLEENRRMRADKETFVEQNRLMRQELSELRADLVSLFRNLVSGKSGETQPPPSSSLTSKNP